MGEFKLVKRLVFEAIRIVEAENGVEAARQLHDWKPTTWNSRDGDWSVEPYLDPDRLGAGWDDSRPVYEVRWCRGHFHVTCCGEDIAIDGDPFPTREAAEAARLREESGAAGAREP